MRNVLFAVLAVAIPVAAFAAPPRLPGEERMERPRPVIQKEEVQRNEQLRSNDMLRPERIPEAVKQMLKHDVCKNANALCN